MPAEAHYHNPIPPSQHVYGENSLLRQAMPRQDQTPVFAQPSPQGKEQQYPQPSDNPLMRKDNDSGELTCNCGLKAAVRQVKKEGSRFFGQWFACCPNTDASKQCDFKKWNVSPPSQTKQNYPPIGPRMEEAERVIANLYNQVAALNEKVKVLWLQQFNQRME